MYPLLIANVLRSRLTSFQRYKHTLGRAGAQAQFCNDMDSDSLLVQGQFDCLKWKKVNSRTFGITGSMVPSYSWAVLHILRSEGFQAYLVGGCVRDLILNKKPKDFDVITTATLKQIRKQFRRCEIVGRRFPICMVHIKGSVVEVSSFETMAQHEVDKGERTRYLKLYGYDAKDLLLWENSMHRDFTINSLFFDPFANKIYDYANGIKDLRSLKLQTLIPAQMSFKEDCARILRGLRIAARLGLYLSKDLEAALHKLSPLIGTLNKARLMLELNYMFSYGAAEHSLGLLRRYKLLEILFPFHAVYFSQNSDLSSQHAMMLMKLFFHLDELFSCDQPSNCCLWVGLLAFHQALVKNPQQSLVVLTFASVLYHGKWKKSVEYARQHAKTSICFAPEVLKNIDCISNDELGHRVAQLGNLVQDSIGVLTDRNSLIETMARFPGFSCSGLVFVSKKVGQTVAKIFDCLVHDVETCKIRRKANDIDYPSLINGRVKEMRCTLGKIIMETLGCVVSLTDEVIDNKDNLLPLDVEPKSEVFQENSCKDNDLKRSRTMEKNDEKPVTPESDSKREQTTVKRQKVVQNKKTSEHETEEKAPASKNPNEVEAEERDMTGRRMAGKYKRMTTVEIDCALGEGKIAMDEARDVLHEERTIMQENKPEKEECLLKQVTGDGMAQVTTEKHVLEVDEQEASGNEAEKRQNLTVKLSCPLVAGSERKGMLECGANSELDRKVAKRNSSHREVVEVKSIGLKLSSIFGR